jgi:hypothetical protein
MGYAIAVNFALLALLALLVVGLLRAHAEVLRRLENLDRAGAVIGTANGDAPQPEATGDREVGSGVGEIAQPILGHRPGGGAAAIDFRAKRDGTLLTFLSAGCVSCGEIWEAITTGKGDLAALGIARVVIVTKGPGEEDPVRIQRLAGGFRDVVMSSEAFGHYAADFTPYFVLVKPSGEIAGVGTAQSWEQMLAMIREATLDEEFAKRLTPRRGVLELARGWTRRSRRRVETPADQAARAEAELSAAGIGRGHPSLYPERRADPDGV